MTPDLPVPQALPQPVPMIEGGRMAEPETGRGRSVRQHLRPLDHPEDLTPREVVVMLHVRTSRHGVSPRHMTGGEPAVAR
jgi:hypothetical protein